MHSKNPNRLLQQLRTPCLKSYMLIERYLGFPGDENGCRPYTRDIDAALGLIPPGVPFVCGRGGDGSMFWCDVGFRPRVQAWGESLPCAIAAAAFAYRMHPVVVAGNAEGGQGAAGN